MRPLNKRELNILRVCIVLVSVYFVFTFAFKPWQEQGAGLEEQLAAARSALAKNHQIIASGPVVEAEYLGLAEVWGTAGSEGAEFSAMVATLENAARAANVRIVNIQPRRSFKRDSLRIFPVEMVVDGQWEPMVRFLYLMQSPPDIFTIEQLTLEKYASSDGVLTNAALHGKITLSRGRLPQGD